MESYRRTVSSSLQTTRISLSALNSIILVTSCEPKLRAKCVLVASQKMLQVVSATPRSLAAARTPLRENCTRKFTTPSRVRRSHDVCQFDEARANDSASSPLSFCLLTRVYPYVDRFDTRRTSQDDRFRRSSST